MYHTIIIIYHVLMIYFLQLKQFFNLIFFFFNYFCHFSAARLKALNGIERFISTNNSTKTRFYINQPSNARLLMLNCVCLYIGY